MPALLNHTTKVDAHRTLGEVSAMLARRGASAIATEYDGGQPAGLSFILATLHGPRHFKLPVNVDGVHAVLVKQRQAGQIDRDRFTTRAHARNVAWRIVKDWLDSQFALIDADLATMVQIMLPYLVVGENATLYDVYLDNEGRAIGGGAP